MEIKLEYLDAVLVEPSLGKMVVHICSKEDSYYPGREINTEEEINILQIKRNWEVIYQADKYTPREFDGFCKPQGTNIGGKVFRN